MLYFYLKTILDVHMHSPTQSVKGIPPLTEPSLRKQIFGDDNIEDMLNIERVIFDLNKPQPGGVEERECHQCVSVSGMSN